MLHLLMRTYFHKNFLGFSKLDYFMLACENELFVRDLRGFLKGGLVVSCSTIIEVSP